MKPLPYLQPPFVSIHHLLPSLAALAEQTQWFSQPALLAVSVQSQSSFSCEELAGEVCGVVQATLPRCRSWCWSCLELCGHIWLQSSSRVSSCLPSRASRCSWCLHSWKRCYATVSSQCGWWFRSLKWHLHALVQLPSLLAPVCVWGGDSFIWSQVQRMVVVVCQRL